MPMRRELYPEDWEEIAFRIKEKAGWKCQNCGKQCRRPGEPLDTHKRTLTVAHLNHIPEDCRDENLRALCAPCHLKYDAQHHAETRKKNNELSRIQLRESDELQIFDWMVKDLGLKGNDLLVYAVIYKWSHGEGQWYTGGQRYLAEWCGSTTRGIQRNVKNLKKAGLIIEGLSDADGRWNEYKVNTTALLLIGRTNDA